MKIITSFAVIAVALALVLPFSSIEAKWLEKPQPDLPFGVFYQGLQGSVVLSLVLDKSGRVTDTRVLKNSGHPALDELALAAALQWRLSQDSVLPTDLTRGRVELVTFRHLSTPKTLLPGAKPYWAQLTR
jgi:TonB family protein